MAASLAQDAAAYTRIFSPLVRDLDKILPAFLGSMRSPPAHPLAAGGFGLRGLPSARHMARAFGTEEGRALVAGTAAHSMLPLTAPLSGVFPRLFTALAHRYGWPVVEGGSGAIVDALVSELSARGGRVETGRLVKRLDDLPSGAGGRARRHSRASWSRWRATPCRPRTAGPSPATATGPGCARWTGLSAGRSRGAPRAAGRP